MQPQTPQVPSGSPLPADNNPASPPPPPQPSPPAPPVVPTSPMPSSNPVVTSPLPVQPVVSPPQPSPVPGPMPEPQPLMTSSAYKQGRNFSKKIILASIIVGALLLIGGGVFAFTKMTGGVKLTKYSDDNIEILYPENYKKKTIPGEGVQFTEDVPKGSENTQSVIVVDTGDIGDADESQKKKFFDDFESNLKGGFASFDGEDIAIDKNERIKHNGNEAIKLKGTYKVDGKKAGTIVAIGALTKDKYYIAIMGVHTSDPGLEKKADAIINSLKLK